MFGKGGKDRIRGGRRAGKEEEEEEKGKMKRNWGRWENKVGGEEEEKK